MAVQKQEASIKPKSTPQAHLNHPEAISIPTPTSSPDVPDHIIRLPEVKRRTGLSRSAIYGLIKKGGRFPRQRKIAGTNAVGWSYLAVQEYIRATLAGGE